MRHLLFKLSFAALALSALFVAAALPSAQADDPLVSLSYLTGSYRDGLLSDVDVAVGAARRQLSADFTAQIASLTNPPVTTPQTVQNDFQPVSLGGGQEAAVRAGGEVLVVSGDALAAGAGLVDATAGTPVAAGTALLANHLYAASADSSVRAGSECRLLVK